MNNSIIKEVREARAALAKEHGYDRQKILEWAREKQAQHKTKMPGIVMANKQSDKLISKQPLPTTDAASRSSR